MTRRLFIEIPESRRRLLMSEETSRQNKLWLATGWRHHHGWFIEWKWAGTPPDFRTGGAMRSRLMFRFAPKGKFESARSFDEDVAPTFEFGKERRQ